MTDILIIDWSNLIYRAGYAGNTDLKDPNTGRVTNTFHYSLRMFETYLTQYSPKAVLIALDNPHFQYARRNIWPEYKMRRKEVKDKDGVKARISQDMHELNNLLRHMPIYFCYWDTLEADDVIAWACRKLWPYLHKVVVSTDKDMLQLVGPTCSILYPGKTERLVTTTNWVEHLSSMLKLDEDMVPTREQYVDYKCLVGETGPTSDNVPGVEGYGPKKAAKLLKDHGSITRAYVALKAKAETSKKLGKLETRFLEENTAKLLGRNKTLMDLNSYLPENGKHPGIKFFVGDWNPAVILEFMQTWSLAKLYSGPLVTLLGTLANSEFFKESLKSRA